MKKAITTIACASLLALAGSVSAQELTASQMDQVTAGAAFGGGLALSTAAGVGGNASASKTWINAGSSANVPFESGSSYVETTGENASFSFVPGPNVSGAGSFGIWVSGAGF